MASIYRSNTGYTFIHFFVKYLSLFAFINRQFVVASSRIEGSDLESFRGVGWVGAESSKSFALPRDYNYSLEFLSHDVSGNGVWVEDQDSGGRMVYRFNGLSKYCDITHATVSVKYFVNQASAFVTPCKDGLGGGTFCYLRTSWRGEWQTETFELSEFNEVSIVVILPKAGYLMFDSVTIEHDGNETNIDGCGTTTLDPTTTTDSTTQWETTRQEDGGPTATQDMEGTEGTWLPPSASPLPTTTTEDTPTFVTIEPTGTTVDGGSEELEDPDTTTENSGLPTTTEELTSTTSESSISSTEPSETTEGSSDPSTTTEVERSTPDVTTDAEFPTTTEAPEPCNHTCEYVGVDCHTYYSCVNFRYKEFHTCPREHGLAFNPRLGVCDFIENVDECRNCTCEYFPDHDCKRYYYCPDVCHLDQCELRECPNGLLWSINADGRGHQQCAVASIAKCAPAGMALKNSVLNYVLGP